MDPDRAAQMVANIGTGLAALDPDHQDTYSQNAQAALDALDSGLEGTEALADLPLITFHDGFQYFSQATGLDLLKAIEEEEGSTASAQEIQEIVDAIKINQKYDLGTIPIFTEVNGSTASADTIAREVGCDVYQLDLIMSGDGTGLQPYLDAMQKNVDTLVEALA